MRIALCNEVLGTLPFDAQCALAAALGYDGLELAPFTLADDALSLGAAQRAAIRRQANDAGLQIAGLHWLLARPPGLSITEADLQVRRRTRERLFGLVDLCADLGGSYLVHGSPAQRRLPEHDADAARARAVDLLAEVAERAGRAGLVHCLEPLAPPEANFVHTIAEAAAIVRSVGHPALRTMLDCCAAARAEGQSPAALLDRWLPTGLIAHVQVNDPNLRGPGQGELPMRPVLAALKRHGYDGWIAVEPFDYVPDGPGCAARAIGYLRGALEDL